MKDTLRQPDGKIRTACKFCRQRKKRCSGEMPCASCVNFNRDCCVYDRWSSSASSSRAKEVPSLNKQFNWAERGHTTQPTSPCFTSKVLLTKVQPTYTQFCPAPLLLQPAFVPQSTPSSYEAMEASPSEVPELSFSNSIPWSPYDSPLSMHSSPHTPADAMVRTISLPTFQDRSWTHDDSPACKPSSLPLSGFAMDGWTQASSPSSQASSSNSPKTMSGMLSPSSYTSPNESQSFLSLLYEGEKETMEMLQNVDALLMQLANPTSA